MSVAAVLTAAGSGSRLGHTLPKALVPLGDDPLVLHAARRLLAARTSSGERVTTLVVTAPADHHAHVVQSLQGLPDDVRVVVVAGGPTRQASVGAALAHLDDDTDVVLVHDAARPFAPPELVARVVDAVRSGHRAVVPGVPVTDTIKQVDVAAGDPLPVVATVARDRLRAVQTPQGFDRALLDTAHRSAAQHAHDETLAASDDAGLVERLGEPVWVVAGDERAAKITTARDLLLAEVVLAAEPPSGVRAARAGENPEEP